MRNSTIMLYAKKNGNCPHFIPKTINLANLLRKDEKINYHMRKLHVSSSPRVEPTRTSERNSLKKFRNKVNIWCFISANAV